MATPKQAGPGLLRDEIARLLKAGKKPAEFVREIMERRGVSKVTVYRHLKRLGWRRPKGKKRTAKSRRAATARPRRPSRGSTSLLKQAAERLSLKDIGKLKRIKRIQESLAEAQKDQAATERAIAVAKRNHASALQKTRSLQRALGRMTKE